MTLSPYESARRARALAETTLFWNINRNWAYFAPSTAGFIGLIVTLVHQWMKGTDLAAVHILVAAALYAVLWAMFIYFIGWAGSHVRNYIWVAPARMHEEHQSTITVQAQTIRRLEARIVGQDTLMAERQKNERPELVGGITGMSTIPVSETRCHVQIGAWVRNVRHVATRVRVSVNLRNTQGEPLFVRSSVVSPETNLGLLLQKERLEYGGRIEGFLELDVETPMANVNGTVATVTLIDDFDQTTLLRLSTLPT
jgi:hypothetical protein